MGWELADTLRVSASINALDKAIQQAVSMTGCEDLSGLIHHSDRGVQYCCDKYVNALNNNKIAISMTEDYNPTDNAIAERINGIIKTELVYQLRLMEDITQARECIGRYIDFYNDRRPHMSIDYKTPAAAHLQTGELNKKWKKKKYPNKKKNDEENELYLQNRTTSQGEGICQQF